jgi:starch synthase (maltosyl-transferring)
VDNPHTKPLDFWHWLIWQVKQLDPDVIFLAEAFTRPAMMHTLAKIGFTQSYTYFTWRTGKWELTEYLHELVGAADYMRPNFFVNTPDILHASLQYGGPPMFAIRAVLASLLSPTWGVYSGYELFEHTAREPGSEEYLNSEKYELRPRDHAAAEHAGHSLAPLLTKLNAVRRRHPALHWLRNLWFHQVGDDALMCWSKRDEQTGDTVLVVLTLDPFDPRESMVNLDLPALGLEWHERFEVYDEMTGATYDWGPHNYVRLDPHQMPAHVFAVRRHQQ